LVGVAGRFIPPHQGFCFLSSCCLFVYL
jgi:hypothetical protein